MSEVPPWTKPAPWTYSGVGSRKTPLEVQRKLAAFAHEMAKRNWILRSGGSIGADEAFETGALPYGPKALRIYLPWLGYRGRRSLKDYEFMGQLPRYAEVIAEKAHPAWGRCGSIARSLLKRNAYVVLGDRLDAPSRFLICWTQGSGGTRHAIRIARSYGVPVFNFADRDWSPVEVARTLKNGRT